MARSHSDVLDTASRRRWVAEAVRCIERDALRSADTHLVPLDLPGLGGVSLYVKDESTHPTGSLKHRLARSLFLHALCSGWIGPGTTVVEASSGSTAVSEAYYARLLGLPFVAVMPRGTSASKIALIERQGGRCHLVERADQVYGAARELAARGGGHYMDQFTYAERVSDWRGEDNVAASILAQMAGEAHPVPRWFVVGAGTGGTSATIGRHLRRRGVDAGVCVVDPEHSVFLDYHRHRDAGIVADRASEVEGIGRPRVEPSFLPDVVDRMLRVPAVASFAAMRVLASICGRRLGGSTGTAFCGALELACEMVARGERGSVVMLGCDDGDRYLDTYYDDGWLRERGHDLAPWLRAVESACGSGRWRPPVAAQPVAGVPVAAG